MSPPSNYAYGIAGFVVPTLCLAVAIPVLVHELGREGFGIYFFAISLAGTVALLELGIANAVVRHVASDLANGRRAEARDAVLASALVHVVLGVLAGASIWALAPWLASIFGGAAVAAADTEATFRIAALLMTPALLLGTCVAFFKGLHRFDLVASVASLLAIGTYGGAAVAAALFSPSIADAVLIALLSNCIALGFCVLQGWRVCRDQGISLVGASPRWATYQRLFKFGKYMAFNSVSAFFVLHVQRYLVGAFLGPSALAVYQIAYTVPFKAYQLVNSGAEILFPRASAFEKGVELRTVYLKVLGASLLLATLTLGLLWLFAEQVLRLWVGADLARDVAAIITPMVIAFFVISLSPAPYHVANGFNRPGVNSFFYALNAVLNMSLIGLLALDGLTLEDFAWAFAAANVAVGVLHQGTVEILVWRERKGFEVKEWDEELAERGSAGL